MPKLKTALSGETELQINHGYKRVSYLGKHKFSQGKVIFSVLPILPREGPVKIKVKPRSQTGS